MMAVGAGAKPRRRGFARTCGRVQRVHGSGSVHGLFVVSWIAGFSGQTRQNHIAGRRYSSVEAGKIRRHQRDGPSGFRGEERRGG